MYLKSITLKNVGPIQEVDLPLPFDGEGRPLPTVLVGTNGSGKTTLISFIANALITFKQQVFDEAEVEANRVFRVRSRLFLRGGAHFYHAKLQFDDDLSMEEWVLDRPKNEFETDVPIEEKPNNEDWKQQIPDKGFSALVVSPSTQPPPLGVRPEPKLAKLFSENVVLYFPSDRFEPPDWLNQSDLSAKLKTDPTTVEGKTDRLVYSRSSLKPTLEWLRGVKFDQLIVDRSQQLTENFRFGFPASNSTPAPKQSKELLIVRFATQVLEHVLRVSPDSTDIRFGARNHRLLSAAISETGKQPSFIPNLIGLSAGQSALFCLFCNIIRDFDLAGAQFSKLNEIRGIVVIDEADLHLHLDLQFKVLPELMKMFPKVQFIVTAHSPMFVMGMRNTFTEDGFLLVDMPSGNKISTEAYSEFVQAFEAFERTKTFKESLRAEMEKTSKPLLFVEGKNDRTHLETAWSKLHPQKERPFDILSCGDNGTGDNKDNGGVNQLKIRLETIGNWEERPVVGLFDNDRAGAGAFGGLGVKHGYSTTANPLHSRHKKGFVHAFLLPVPDERRDFAPDAIDSRVLELEHYYSDAVLTAAGVSEAPVYPGAKPFRIRSDKSKKTAFAESVDELPETDFANFEPLFVQLLKIFNSPPTRSEVSA